MMTPKSRTRLFGVIRFHALAVSVAWAHPREIDRDNILAATLSAMGRGPRPPAGAGGGGWGRARGGARRAGAAASRAAPPLNTSMACGGA